ncbi:guanosine-3',5'-bis(Diphosphate) 3'-pyrophosphohydrolase [Candidatus Pelagibacter sp. IMCC9063]|uniref:HD domain-containing protein n=1 Tax=Pelagibacter sp. (strain IMCC9063) TaxID=1002672 RepID=UPI0002046714|nr:HD domain-containing protein [Candidatus Pelagibacter sp. IMCC9063]AEA81440.1 guanosine-3',5'-bis(Diphosphate) 3'-pyrophosphohydrolase [Candidatus Pelagibacter sp. IMCC9063]
MNLERAIEIAQEAHKGVKDRGGHDYINHPIRVMHAMSNDQEKIVAILHDVVEDSDWTFERLKEEGFEDSVIESLRCVTKYSEEEDYQEFIKRAATNKIATKVKMADIEDNLDLSRLGTLTEKDLTRIEKYKKALKYLKAL